LTDLPLDTTVTIELRGDKASYLHPATALAGADARAVRAFDILLKLVTTAQVSHSLVVLQEQVLQLLMAEIPAEAATIVLTSGNSDQITSVFGKRADGKDGILVSKTIVAKVLKDKT